MRQDNGIDWPKPPGSSTRTEYNHPIATLPSIIDTPPPAPFRSTRKYPGRAHGDPAIVPEPSSMAAH
jgi:hypothetical protein